MSYAINNGIKIYYEVEGQGQPIVLVHGLTGDTTFWRGYGYVEHLQEMFTVIAIDMRGHGKSDKPHEPAAYDYDLLVGDVLAVMDAEFVDQAHYWGYSMGGHVGFNLAVRGPARLMSLIAGGTDLYYSAAEDKEPDAMSLIFERGALEGPDAMVEGMTSLFGSISPQYAARLRSLDPQAMIAYRENARQRGGLAGAISGIHLPCLLYAGDEDDGCYESSLLAADEMPAARFFSLPGLNHAGASSAVDLIMPQVISFLTSLKA
jgi:pimeloyl-ACP methyl ester carboxylesterase